MSHKNRKQRQQPPHQPESAKATMAANISAISGLSLSEKPVTTNDLTVENPKDVYPIAQAFWQMTLSKLEKLPAEETLYVFLGEFHDAPTHKITQAAILSLAAAWRDAAAPGENRNFAFARELPFNNIIGTSENFRLVVPPSVKYTLPGQDRDGSLLARALTAKSLYQSAPLSTAYFYSQALAHNVPLAYTDCAMESVFFRQHVDPEDPVWPKAASLLGWSPDEIDHFTNPVKRPGIAWRNASMVTRAEEAAERHKARIVFQHGGQSHLLGKSSEGCPFEESWLGLQEKAGHAAIGLFIAPDQDLLLDSLPPAADLARLRGAIMIARNLDYGRFDIEQPAQERAYIESLRTAFSGPATLVPPSGAPPRQKAVKAELQAAIDRAVAKEPPQPPSAQPPAPGPV